MKLNRTGSNWTELERNKINENWGIIEGNHNKLEGEFNDVIGKITDEVVGHLIDSAKLIWKEPVDTVADLPANAEVGETRMVREADPDGISYVYRYDGEKWEKIQAIDVTLVNEVDRRLTRQLADIVQEVSKKADEATKNKADSVLRVGTFNVRGAQADYPAILEILNNTSMDLVGTQEFRQLKGDNDTGELTSGKLIDYFFQVNLENDVRDYGNAVFSKYNLTENIGQKYDYQGSEDRGYSKSDVLIDGRVVSFYNTHIGLTSYEHQHQIEELITKIDNDKNEYKIIVGDFNVTIHHPVLNTLLDKGYISAQGYDGIEYPTYQDGKQIDHIFVTPNFDVLKVAMVESGDASDHNLLYMDLKMPNDLRFMREEVTEHRRRNFSNSTDIHGLLSGGKIIEDSGGNENGFYIKFAEGTMVCFGREVLTFAQDAFLRSFWNFPESFKDKPEVFGTPKYSSKALPTTSWGVFMSHEADTNKNRAVFRLYSLEGLETPWQPQHEVPYSALAIGKWK